MTTGIRSDASGTFGALTFGGDDAVTFDDTGIKAGSYKAGSIVATDFADGALIENSANGIGYGPGAGGTVTQSTSKSTAVTLNKPCGKITMNAASLAAGATVFFQFNNSVFNYNQGDSLLVETNNPASYTIKSGGGDIGNAYIALKNETGAPLAEAVVVIFKVIKGTTS